MRHALTLAALLALSAGAAHAETWTKFIDGENGIAWSYDADYAHRDSATGKVVVMQAISKASANIGPSAPGKPDGVGNVAAIDCKKDTMLLLGSYTPSTPLVINDKWRKLVGKKVQGPENIALAKAVCAKADTLPVK